MVGGHGLNIARAWGRGDTVMGASSLPRRPSCRRCLALADGVGLGAGCPFTTRNRVDPFLHRPEPLPVPAQAPDQGDGEDEGSLRGREESQCKGVL